jgi:hypothetical protein
MLVGLASEHRPPPGSLCTLLSASSSRVGLCPLPFLRSHTDIVERSESLRWFSVVIAGCPLVEGTGQEGSRVRAEEERAAGGLTLALDLSSSFRAPA